MSDRPNWEYLERNSGSGPISAGVKNSGSPRAAVKEKNSLFISFHVQCAQINFKGGWDVGRKILSAIGYYLCVEPISAGISSSTNKPFHIPW